MRGGSGPSLDLRASVGIEAARATRNTEENPLNADSQVVEAEVRVGEETVQYRRAGTGTPVLLLHASMSPGETGAGGEADTFASLSRRYRVFQPLTPIPVTPDNAEKWLRGVVEALGLIAPAVVADPELAPVLARLVHDNRGFVGRVVFPARRGPADEIWEGL
jgi:hypothetical protein